MIKKTLNQNGKYVQELVDSIETDFIFNNQPINRFKVIKNNKYYNDQDKTGQLLELKKKINSIENCNLKEN